MNERDLQFMKNLESVLAEEKVVVLISCESLARHETIRHNVRYRAGAGKIDGADDRSGAILRG